MPTGSVPVGSGTANVGALARAARAFSPSPRRLVRPVPDKLTCCGLSVLLSVIERLAVNWPVVLGLKTTEIPQEAAAATLEPQPLLLTEKSAALVPVMLTPVMLRAEPPVFVSVTDWGWLVMFSTTVPKSRLKGTIWTVPVESAIATVEILVVSVTDVAVSVTAGLAGLPGIAEGAV